MKGFCRQCGISCKYNMILVQVELDTAVTCRPIVLILHKLKYIKRKKKMNEFHDIVIISVFSCIS